MEDIQIINAIKSGSSINNVLHKLGLSAVGSNYQKVRNIIKAYHIDISHFKPKTTDTYTDEQAFTKDSSCGRCSIRNRLIKYNKIPYTCAICGLSPMWNGAKLTLVLDHINGIHNDNRLTNLRFLCPNCNSQTTTFAGRNRPTMGEKRTTICACGNNKSKQAKTCSICRIKKLKAQTRITKIDWPSKEVLISYLNKYKTYVATAKFLGVSDNALRKRLRNH